MKQSVAGLLVRYKDLEQKVRTVQQGQEKNQAEMAAHKEHGDEVHDLLYTIVEKFCPDT